MKKLEALLLATLGGFALTFLVLSRDYNATAAQFPQLIAVASLLFLVLGSIGSRKPGAGSQKPEAGQLPSGFWLPAPGFRLPILALQAGYVGLMYLVGFFAATLLYLILAPLQLRYPHRGIAIATGLVLTLLIAGSFMWLFQIQLPPGAIWEVL
jgi:tripartite tricarboxylate transporter TctB family protein